MKVSKLLLFTLILGLYSLSNTCFANAYPLNTEPDPVANPKAIVIDGNVRFTVLTPRLIRMEWSPDGKFENRASLVFINRNLPVPRYHKINRRGWLIIKTDYLTLKYKENSGKFTKRNLNISFKMDGKTQTWFPGKVDTANLGGTIRTLDGVNGSIKIAPGLLSREGWHLVNDSNRPLFNNSNWKWVVPRPAGKRQDWYFFGYGHHYKKELADYIKVAGRIPMPPEYAFGYWWSRYWSYTDQGLKDLVHQFHEFNMPLSVLVVDMDWHKTFDLRWHKRRLDQAGQMLGWTGYTWDKNLFPDPRNFLNWCHKQGLKITLNLHPASGIQPFEKHYPEMARAMGINPATKKYVPFDITNKKFATNYFKYILDPLENEGVNFWWIDWQQWDSTSVKGLNPTWWLNYTFYSHMKRENRGRPIILSRWGGLGSHRYQIGFSGDVVSSWKSLKFQPYFTATAANVGFGYWSHDIGGHLPGTVSPQLFTRWVQWGVFSPILRTHTTKNADAERRFWAYPYPYFKAMRKAVLLRYQLIPYIYTASRNAYDTGVSICHPLYYNYPSLNKAYQFKDEYMFGNDMLVAPITKPATSPDSTLTSERVWLPPGKWVEWYSGKHFTGPAVIERSFALDEIPIYVKEGSIIPMQYKKTRTIQHTTDPLVLRIFPTEKGSNRVYEDEGNSLGYQYGQYSWTHVTYDVRDNKILDLKIHAVDGNFPGMANTRSYIIELPDTWPPEKVTANGFNLSYTQNKSDSGWWYDGNKMMTVIRLPETNIFESANVQVYYKNGITSASIDGLPGKIKRLDGAMNILNHLWPTNWSPDDLIHAVQTGDRLTLWPDSAETEVKDFNRILQKLKPEISKLQGNKEIIRHALDHISEIYSASKK